MPQRSELFFARVLALGSHVVFETKGARTLHSTAMYAFTYRILPHTCVKACNMVPCGIYGKPWLRNLQGMMPSSLYIIVGPRAVHGSAVKCSAQKGNAATASICLFQCAREKAQAIARSSSTWSAWSHH